MKTKFAKEKSAYSHALHTYINEDNEASVGPLGVIELTLIDIKNDKSSNTMAQSLDMIEDQVKNIRVLEGLVDP